jgi:hypothetical protein
MKNMFAQGTFRSGIGLSMAGALDLRLGQADKIVDADTGEGQRLQKAPIQPVKLNANANGNVQKPSPRKDRFQWAVSRLCTMMRRFGNTSANPQAVSRVFWAFVKHAKSSEESVITAYKAMCPDLPVPEKPVKKIGDKPVVTVPMTYSEAVQISGELDKAMEQATPEAVVARADAEGSGTLAPEDVPQVEMIREELVAFVSAGDPKAILTVDQEAVAAAERAIAQASEVKKQDTTKLLVAGAAVIGLGALLYYTL